MRPIRQPGRARGRRGLQRFAVVLGGLFVLVGIAALAGDPDAAQGQRRTAKYTRALNVLRDVLGDPGGGIAMIALGLLLGGGLYWVASRRS